ncbi:MAG: STAS domain-containing protein [Fibrobacteres bacterium]|nr:STAS domain-containing protein [Fibrobacterota bacterium]
MPEVKINEGKAGPNSEVTVIRLEGSIDAYNSELLSASLTNLIDKGSKKIVVDCSRLKFISSSGMGVFLAVEDDVNEGGGGLKFAAVPETILSVFSKVGLTDLFRVYAKEEQAIDDFVKGV